MKSTEAVEALAALAQESRLAIFRQLVQDAPDGALPSELAPTLGIAPALLSFHLKALLHAGLVSSEHHGRSIRYRASMDRAQALVGYLLEHCCAGDPQRCAPASACGTASAATFGAPLNDPLS